MKRTQKSTVPSLLKRAKALGQSPLICTVPDAASEQSVKAASAFTQETRSPQQDPVPVTSPAASPSSACCASTEYIEPEPETVAPANGASDLSGPDRASSSSTTDSEDMNDSSTSVSDASTVTSSSLASNLSLEAGRSENSACKKTDTTIPVTETPPPRSATHSVSPRDLWTVQDWITTLSSREHDLLQLEIRTMDRAWLAAMWRELTKPYYLSLKEFLHKQQQLNKTVFPPADQIFSWTRHTAIDKVRVVILGQDPYHNYNQAHGLAFSVNPPTPAPPSLVNIFKELESCYPNSFKRPRDQGGLLTKWADQGVLMLNACLTVEAHKANSHANQGWESFTEQVLRIVLEHNPKGLCFMVWGTPAARRLEKIRPGPKNLVLRSVHPSPLSASRGWFGSRHFVQANNWLQRTYGETINWSLED